jgi:predicted nuclease with RNAse H fold
MSTASQSASIYYVGWDVGGWNCDRNSKSRDAIAILDSPLSPVGIVWRGNLRDNINRAASANDWLRGLFDLCKSSIPTSIEKVVLAIDAPLGYSLQFANLITDLRCVESVGCSSTNEYLFRQTERMLFERGFSPLSSVKDMIGSQSTKALHVLAKFAPATQSCGVWTDGCALTAIEAYPSACRHSSLLRELRNRGQYVSQSTDKDDALTCALIAYLFDQRRAEMVPPPADVPVVEGWIWLPRDARAKAAEPAI